MPAGNNFVWLLATRVGPELTRASPGTPAALEVNTKEPAVLDTVGWVYHLRGEHERAVVLEGAVVPDRGRVLGRRAGIDYISAIWVIR